MGSGHETSVNVAYAMSMENFYIGLPVCTKFTLLRFSKILQRTSKSGSNALANQNAALDQSQTRFVRMPEHEFESRFEICLLIGHANT